MKTSLPLMLCVATFHVIAFAPATLFAATNDPMLESEIARAALRLKSLPAEYQVVRIPERSLWTESPPPPDTLTTPHWDSPIQETPPRVSLGDRPFAVSGLLVNVLGPKPPVRDEGSWTERAFGMKVGSLPDPRFVPRSKRELKYFQWGERSEPWNVVASQPREPEGVLFALHF